MLKHLPGKHNQKLHGVNKRPGNHNVGGVLLDDLQIKLLHYAGTDKDHVQIADELGYSVSNIDQENARLYKKLGIVPGAAGSKTTLATIGVKAGVIDLNDIEFNHNTIDEKLSAAEKRFLINAAAGLGIEKLSAAQHSLVAKLFKRLGGHTLTGAVLNSYKYGLIEPDVVLNRVAELNITKFGPIKTVNNSADKINFSTVWNSYRLAPNKESRFLSIFEQYGSLELAATPNPEDLVSEPCDFTVKLDNEAAISVWLDDDQLRRDSHQLFVSANLRFENINEQNAKEVVDLLDELAATGRDFGIKGITVNLGSLPLNYLADNGYELDYHSRRLPGTKDRSLNFAHYLAEPALEYLEDNYQLGFSTTDLKSMDFSNFQNHPYIRDVLAIKHPVFEQVPLFVEFLVKSNKAQSLTATQRLDGKVTNG